MPAPEPEPVPLVSIDPKTSYQLEFQRAVDIGITDGSRPDEPATRREVAVMALRSREASK